MGGGRRAPGGGAEGGNCLAGRLALAPGGGLEGGLTMFFPRSPVGPVGPVGPSGPPPLALIEKGRG